ncbi:MAG: hypothetical protein GXP54_05545, partial [Deltaproteobacteria bacterium]|nr:hypothetical protein [Deltaproteobacteria bacterium]
VEFLVDENHSFYFLEMNTRLQVEHPVTEAVLGVDLVGAMVSVAMGDPLPWRQSDLAQRGHAIECRVYAEDPYNNHLPAPGRLYRYKRPSGPFVRVDDGVEEGGEVSQYYDPMIAKVIVWGETRGRAIRRMINALDEYVIGGVRHNIPLLRQVLRSDEFVRGRYDTGILERIGPVKGSGLSVEEAALAVAAGTLLGRGNVMTLGRTADSGPSAWRRSVMPVYGRR